jgi:hypothetical protein
MVDDVMTHCAGLRPYLAQRPARAGHVYHVGQLMGKRADDQLLDYTTGKTGHVTSRLLSYWFKC